MTERSHDAAVGTRRIEGAPTSLPDGVDTPKPPFFRTNRGIGVALVVCFTALAASIGFSDWAGRVLRDGFLLGGFPLFATGFMILAAMILIFDSQAKSVGSAVARFRLSALIIILIAAAVLGIAFLAFGVIGFVPTIVLLVGGAATILGYRPVWSAFVVALVVAAVLRVILYLLDVGIDDGLVWHFLTGIFHG